MKKLFLLLIAGGGLILLIAVDRGYDRNWRQGQALVLDGVAELSKTRLENMATTRFNAVESLGALFVLHPDTTPAAFAHFAAMQMSFNPPIRSLQYADSSTRVTYVYPVRGNEIVIAKPMLLIADPLRGPFTRKAIDENRPVIQGPFPLRQGGVGIVMRAPIVDAAGTFLGLSIGVFDVPVLTDEAFCGVVDERIQVSLADVDGNVFLGPPVEDPSSATRTVSIADTRWTLKVKWADPLSPPMGPHLVIWLGGGALLLAVGALIYLTLAQNERLARLVERRTASLRKSETFLKSTQALARVGGWQWDIDDREMCWTDETYRIHGMASDAITPGAEDHITRSLDCYDAADRPVIMALFNGCVEAGEPYDREFAFTAVDGRRKWIRTLGQPVVERGRVVRAVGHIMDITEQKHLQDRLRHSQKMNAIRTMTGGVAHEFNNLLSIILGNAELALDGDEPLPDSLHDTLDEIVAAVLRGKAVVGQLLDAYWQGRHEIEAVDVDALVSQTLGTLDIPDHVAVHTEMLPEPLCIAADHDGMQQVVVHLCKNALQAMADKGGTLTVRLSRERFDETMIFTGRELAPGQYVCMTVIDTGQGIAADHLERVFDPFFTTRDVDQGTGMGLALVAGIVEHHHGGIEIDSLPGRGTTVRCCFPAIAGERDADDGVAGP